MSIYILRHISRKYFLIKTLITYSFVRMLCYQCRRLAAAAIQRSSTTLSRRAQQIHTSSSAHNRIGALLQPAFNSSTKTRRGITRSYSDSPATKASTSDAPLVPEKPDYLDTHESAIWDKLAAEFAPTELSVQDVSGGCGSMYAIEISSEKFRGANMLKQQRMVNAVLGDQMKSWHGVQLRTKIP
ncbi:bola-like protein [Jackrogersella minutella]|nr:bola-like protein [Jackrogersella minutella]